MDDDKKPILTIGIGIDEVSRVELARRIGEKAACESTDVSLPEATSEQAGPSVNVEDDFHSWLLDQATALRNRNTVALDWDNLAEELEAMAAAERRELKSRMTTLFEHLLKLEYQPKEVPIRGRNWVVAVIKTRVGIRDLLDECPSVKRYTAEFQERAYADAVLIVHQFVPKLPCECPWTFEEAMDSKFIPNKNLLPEPA